MAFNPYLKIKQNQIMTASPAELTLMLYDGAIKFSNQALQAMEDGDTEKTHMLIVKVQNIIREFQLTLDDRYEVAKDLAIMYDFVYTKLVKANIKKDSSELKEALYVIRELRSTWKEASMIAKSSDNVVKERTRVAL